MDPRRHSGTGAVLTAEVAARRAFGAPSGATGDTGASGAPGPAGPDRLRGRMVRGRFRRGEPASPAPLEIVLIEDSGAYASLVAEMLRDGFAERFRLSVFGDLDSAEGALAGPAADCVLLDLALPDAFGLAALERVQVIAPGLPVVVLSGDADEQLAIDAVHLGAQDYLVKRDARPAILTRSIRYAIERKQVELELSFLALHDSLTGLANRALFIDRLSLALARSRRSDTWVAVIFLDLNRFKAVNDSLGHELGDKLLIQVAARLRLLVRPGDTVARFGGDEFMVLCDELEDESAAVRITERLTTGMEEPFRVGSHDIHVGVSAGVALERSSTTSAEALIRNADKTMYRAKQSTRRYALYDEAAHASSLRRLELESELVGARERGELEVHYQPIVDLRTSSPTRIEALLRWRHPERGLLRPEEFLSIAFETGLIFEIGEWVLGDACATASRLVKAGHDVVVSANLSPRELLRPELVDALTARLAHAGLTPDRLCLEVTEDAVASDPDRLIEVLVRLRALGTRIAMDDFGTGHSSLSALARYPLDVVKLDRAFLDRLVDDERHERMLKAVIDVAHTFALTAIAEGVETRAQLARLRALGCDLGQGYLFARPLPGAALEHVFADPNERNDP